MLRIVAKTVDLVLSCALLAGFRVAVRLTEQDKRWMASTPLSLRSG